MEARKGHFMNPNLVKSQFEALEIPDYGLQVDVSIDLDTITRRITSQLQNISTQAKNSPKSNCEMKWITA